MALSSSSTLLVFLLLISSSSSALLTPSGVNHEVQALMAIKNLLDDPQGVLNTWDVDSVNSCTWTFVTCSPELLVIILEAPSQNLSGRLSPSIGNLTNLESLLLQINNITGPIPKEIGKLAKIMTLNLSSNHLYGEIPSSVTRLGRLQYLDLSYNNLSSPVPRLFAGTVNVIGNPLICGESTGPNCSSTAPVSISYNQKISQASLPTAKANKFAVALGSTISCIIFLSSPIA